MTRKKIIRVLVGIPGSMTREYIWVPGYIYGALACNREAITIEGGNKPVFRKTWNVIHLSSGQRVMRVDTKKIAVDVIQTIENTTDWYSPAPLATEELFQAMLKLHEVYGTPKLSRKFVGQRLEHRARDAEERYVEELKSKYKKG